MRVISIDSQAVSERGVGVRFALPEWGAHTTGFVVRYDGRVYAYVNRCAHVPVELDWTLGQFFDVTGNALICATHGALYLPESGQCVAGPCKGRLLQRLPAHEQHGVIQIEIAAT